MKNVLKNEVCGTCKQCIGTLLMGEKLKSYDWKKKTLKRKIANGKRKMRFPNAPLDGGV